MGKLIENIYRTKLFARADDMGTARYFSAKDFEGLFSENYSFLSSKGDTLKGKFYYYENPIKNRLVVFDHGIGGGHLSYMKEIEMLCRSGFLVFSYDHTGCMESGGESSNGLGQSLTDLNDCLTALKKEERLKGYDFSVMGHSWGGFSTLNISAFHPDISHIVVMSGFISVKAMLSQFVPSPLGFILKPLLKVEEKYNPESLKCNAVETLRNTKAKALLIYSEDDMSVKKALHYDVLLENLKDKDNIDFLLVRNKGHNPDYTEDAVSYFNGYLKRLAKEKKTLTTEEKKKAFVDSFDWDRMTTMDEAVWEKIICHLKG